MDSILALFKFGSRPHIEELIHEGHLYMNPLSTFIRMESDFLRADADEGLRWSAAVGNAKLQMQQDGKWTTVGTLSGPIRSHDPRIQAANVFCMYAYRASNTAGLIDTRNFQFGDSFAAFTDGDEFLRRVRTAVAKLGLNLQMGLMRYVDPISYAGEMSIFTKYADFSFQSEFRIALLPGTGVPYSLKLGDLSDIATIGELRSVNQRIRLKKV